VEGGPHGRWRGGGGWDGWGEGDGGVEGGAEGRVRGKEREGSGVAVGGVGGSGDWSVSERGG